MPSIKFVGFSGIKKHAGV